MYIGKANEVLAGKDLISDLLWFLALLLHEMVVDGHQSLGGGEDWIRDAMSSQLGHPLDGLREII